MGKMRYSAHMERVSEGLRSLGISHGFSTGREGDYRTVTLPSGVATAKQVHGTHAIWAVAPGRHPEEADAVLTAKGGGAGVLTADCVPILLVDPVAGLAAAVHAGWRGTLANVIQSSVSALVAKGADPGRMSAAIGPCIRACCYQVSEEMISDFSHAFGPAVARPGRLLDLAHANRQRLAAAGISEKKISDLGECTRCTRDGDVPRYFSHRRDATPARLLSWIRLAG